MVDHTIILDAGHYDYSTDPNAAHKPAWTWSKVGPIYSGWTLWDVDTMDIITGLPPGDLEALLDPLIAINRFERLEEAALFKDDFDMKYFMWEVASYG